MHVCVCVCSCVHVHLCESVLCVSVYVLSSFPSVLDPEICIYVFALVSAPQPGLGSSHPAWGKEGIGKQDRDRASTFQNTGSGIMFTSAASSWRRLPSLPFFASSRGPSLPVPGEASFLPISCLFPFPNPHTWLLLCRTL